MVSFFSGVSAFPAVLPQSRATDDRRIIARLLRIQFLPHALGAAVAAALDVQAWTKSSPGWRARHSQSVRREAWRQASCARVLGEPATRLQEGRFSSR